MQTIKSFFDELAPRLDTARVLDHELDRNLARRFNVLDYLKTDELGLSRIIADLLNPEATHGQGVLFLRTFLANFKSFHEPLKNWPDLDRRTSVVREQRTEEGRQIDVVVEIHGPDGKYCLAIENKPYDRDRENQVKHYLEHLKGKNAKRFLLIYLSPTGEEPSEWSIHKDELNEKWKGRFAIMPYYRNRSHEEVEDELNDFRLSHSLADWLGESRKNCDVERLRWFLRDAETFCQRKFGGQTMTTCSETKAVVEKYVLLDKDKWKIAGEIYESLPAIRNRVCQEFLGQVRSAIEQKARANATLKKFFGDMGDMQVKCNYESEREYKNWICMYRDCWLQYERELRSISDRRTAVLLQNDKSGPNDWFIAVWSPMPPSEMADEEKKRLERLQKGLEKLEVLSSNQGSEAHWPWWEGVAEDKKDWDSLVPELHKECQNNGGKITSYFVDRFIAIAKQAVPIIDKIETDNSRT